MHFIDQVHLVSTTHWHVLRVFQKFTGIVDPGSRGGVNFDEIEKAAFADIDASGTNQARTGRHAIGFAIQALGQNSGNSRLPDTARTGEQIRVMNPIMIERMSECPDDMFLSDQRTESGGP